VVGGDADWAREILRQLIQEIEVVSSGMAEGRQLLHHYTPAQAGDRIDDLRRRLEQVDRLIEAIEGMRENSEDDEGDPVLPHDAAMDGRKGRSSRGPLAN
jgi:hypothetical protein